MEGVHTCNIQELFLRLCSSILNQSTSQPFSIVEFCFHKPAKRFHDGNRVQYLVRQLRHMCMDVILLRQWEWRTTETHTISHCLGVALSLHYQGHTSQASSLASAMTWLLQGNCSEVTEPDNILNFLFLLSRPSAGNTRVDTPLRMDGQIYKFYPSAMFECPLDPKDAALKTSVATTSKLFNSPPTSGLAGFMAKEVSEEDMNLFGGLTHSISTDLNEPLGLPHLPSDHNDVTLLPKSPRIVPEMSAVIPAVALPTHIPAVATPTQVAPPTQGLHLFSMLSAQKGAGLLLHTWEGWDTSLPFLFDAVAPACKHASTVLTTKYAALAGLSLSSPSSGTLLLPQVLASAIDNMPSPPLPPVMDSDDVLFSISRVLYNLLTCCRTTLLSPGCCKLSLLQTQQATHYVLPVTRFVLSLLQADTHMQKFEVMDSFFRQCLQLQGIPHYYLFLSILSQALLSYFKTVEQWVYGGILSSTQWIGIQTDHNALEMRDATYWTNGYTVAKSCTPNFLSHLNHSILTCGKALNLLRICLPKHPLCVGQFVRPHLQLSFSSQQLNQVQCGCEVYRSEVSSACVNMAEQLELERTAREDKVRRLQVQARQAAREEGLRVRELERAQVVADQQRKHSLAVELKENMLRARELRAEQLAAQRQADRQYQAAQQEQELELREKEAKLEQEVREEMERYYQELSEEAEQRKARAEWKLARLNLAPARKAFWKSEEHTWTQGDGTISDVLSFSEQDTLSQQDTLQDTAPPEQDTLQDTASPEQDRTLPHQDTLSPLQQDTIQDTAPLHQDTAPPHQDTAPPHQDTPSLQQDTAILEPFIDHSTPSSLDHTPVFTDPLSSDPAESDTDLPPQDPGHPQLVSTRGHAPPQDPGHPQLVSTRGHAPLSTIFQHDDVTSVQDPQDHVPDSSKDHTHLGLVQDVGDPRLVSTRGHAPPHSRDHAPLGLVQDVGDPQLVSTRGHAPPCSRDHTPLGPIQDVGDPRLVSTRGQAPPCSRDHTPLGPVQDVGDPRLVSTRGHAPHSTIERLLGGGEEKKVKKKPEIHPTEEDIVLASFHKYQDSFPALGGVQSLHDVLAHIVKILPEPEVDVEFLNVFPLPALLANSIDLPLLTQSSLVNSSLLEFLVSHCQLHHHFLTLKRFLLLEDGEFGHALSTKLCEQLNSMSDWRQLTSPSFLNPLLVSSLEASLYHNTVSANHLGFSLKFQPHTIHANAVKALDFLELKYRVDWPCNIIITSGCLHRYNKVLHFLLEMKRSSWVLKQTFHWLKHCSVLNKLKIRQLQTYRHEFQHFVNIIHGYISSQLFGHTWEEFQTELGQCAGLDNVIQAHNKFIDTAIFRCLLSKKARPVMNLIYDLLSSILTFSSHTQISAHSERPEHSYVGMCQTYKTFRDTVRLLISVLGKLIARGYQPHLEELLLRLNFNGFY